MTARDHYYDTIPMPIVKRACERCSTTDEDIRSGYVIVSPAGLAHHSHAWRDGTTECGLYATGENWWWTL